MKVGAFFDEFSHAVAGLVVRGEVPQCGWRGRSLICVWSRDPLDSMHAELNVEMVPDYANDQPWDSGLEFQLRGQVWSTTDPDYSWSRLFFATHVDRERDHDFIDGVPGMLNGAWDETMAHVKLSPRPTRDAVIAAARDRLERER